MKKTEKNEGLEEIVKAVYKSVLKTYHDKKRTKEGQEIVRDILDPNYVPQVDPDAIPSSRSGVLNKNKGACKACGLVAKMCKCSEYKEKGVKKLKDYVKKNKKIKKDEPIPGLSQK